MKMKIEDFGDSSRIIFIYENDSEWAMLDWMRHQQHLEHKKEKHVSWGLEKFEKKE